MFAWLKIKLNQIYENRPVWPTTHEGGYLPSPLKLNRSLMAIAHPPLKLLSSLLLEW
jgi:hypothetical protein